MERKEAVALLKELGAEQLIQPSLVIIEQRKPDSYQLRMKGEYDRQLIEAFLHKRNFDYEENLDRVLIYFQAIASSFRKIVPYS